MIILKNTTDSIVVSLAGAATTELPCVVSFRDTNAGATVFQPDRKNTLTNDANRVDISGSPISGQQRVIDYISIYNSDNASQTVTIEYNENSVYYLLFKATIGVGEKIEYSNDNRFLVLNNQGAVKTAVNQGGAPLSSGWIMVIAPSNVINNNAVANTLQDFTGLQIPITAGRTYAFRAQIRYNAAATTTGSRWTLNLMGGGAGSLAAVSQYSLTATSVTINNVNNVNLPAASNATSAATTNNIAYIDGFIECTVTGQLQVQFASEIANSAITALAGSFIEYIQVI